MIRSPEDRWGCLTTGTRWSFYFLCPIKSLDTGETEGYQLFASPEMTSDEEEGVYMVMGNRNHLALF